MSFPELCPYAPRRAPRSASRLRADAAVDFRRQGYQLAADLDRIGRARLEPAQRLRQPFEFAFGDKPDVVERRRRLHTPAALHHELKERLTALFVAFQREG